MAKEKPGWKAARRKCIERDGHRCRKCRSSTGLEAHHIVERANGGADDLDNLVTLCSLCHDEITEFDLGSISFECWLKIPPARHLVAVWAMEWPENVSAAQHKRDVEAIMVLAREDHEAGK